MIGITFSKFSSQNGSWLYLVCKETVDPENEEGRMWEVVEAVEWTKVVTLGIIFDGFCEFGFLSAIYASGIDGVH